MTHDDYDYDYDIAAAIEARDDAALEVDRCRVALEKARRRLSVASRAVRVLLMDQADRPLLSASRSPDDDANYEDVTEIARAGGYAAVEAHIAQRSLPPIEAEAKPTLPRDRSRYACEPEPPPPRSTPANGSRAKVKMPRKKRLEVPGVDEDRG